MINDMLNKINNHDFEKVIELANNLRQKQKFTLVIGVQDMITKQCATMCFGSADVMARLNSQISTMVNKEIEKMFAKLQEDQSK